MILASNNAHKLTEIRAILADLGIDLISQREAAKPLKKTPISRQPPSPPRRASPPLRTIPVSRSTPSAASRASIPPAIPGVTRIRTRTATISF